MMWSNLPGLRRALSKLSGLFVAATTITSLLETSWQSSCRRVEDIFTKYSNNLSVVLRLRYLRYFGSLQWSVMGTYNSFFLLLFQMFLSQNRCRLGSKL